MSVDSLLNRDSSVLERQSSIISKISFQEDDEVRPKPTFTRQNSKAIFTRQNTGLSQKSFKENEGENDLEAEERNLDEDQHSDNQSVQSHLSRQNSIKGVLKKQGSRMAALTLARQNTWSSDTPTGFDEILTGGFEVFDKPKLGRQPSSVSSKDFAAKKGNEPKAYFEKQEAFEMPIVRQASQRGSMLARQSTATSFRSADIPDDVSAVSAVSGSAPPGSVPGSISESRVGSPDGRSEKSSAGTAAGARSRSRTKSGVSLGGGSIISNSSSGNGSIHGLVVQSLGEDASAITNPSVGSSRGQLGLVSTTDSHGDQSFITRESSVPKIWHCHCCTAKNASSLKKCRVCGRPESYALQSYPMPLHGKNAILFRPSQLLTAMEDIHAVDSENWTALHTACVEGNLPTVRSLLELKAKVEVTTNKGYTPLHLTAYSGSLECTKELLKHNADINVHSLFEKQTPLHIACEKGFGEIAQVLLQSGADVKALNSLFRTPLHSAAISGRTDIGTLLLRAGADAHALDAHGWNACQIAELFGHRQMQELIIRATMNIKQAVISELPVMPWHSYVWSEVSKTQVKKMQESRIADVRAHEDLLLQQRIKLEKKNEDMMEIRMKRREEIRKQIAYKEIMESRYAAPRKQQPDMPLLLPADSAPLPMVTISAGRGRSESGSATSSVSHLSHGGI